MKHSEYQQLLKIDKNKAQRTIFDEYLNYVYTIAFNRLRSCGSREDIDECVSDIFTDVFGSYESKQAANDDIKGFIATIALRKSAAYYHRLCRNTNSISLDDENTAAFPSDENISESAEKKETQRTLMKLIDSLGEPDSTIIIQKYYYGRSSFEISGFVSLSPAMIRVRSSRALKKLRRLISDNDISV
ncbi:sigma-70 family RNA polymerase sigma factor [Ruminococcus flavefaciens]|uniref:sigma-70 family RNA polymerase sigma factor n=1 Tax=Ruminococcus flavefaciens TaxID=1265 RepID=UPI0026F03764|nr:sigma-70 family RNA polymerase sigma factor [Ruminococcus flavefaciens]